jgi:hypothetical protein
MTPFVDILAEVVTAMKPTISASAAMITGGGATVTVGNMTKSVLNRLFVGQKVKCTFAGTVVYGTIASIAVDSFVITLASSQKVAPSAISVVLNYHHGHLLEVKNTFKEYTTIAAVKREQFPAVVLVQDFPEEINNLTGEREATCTIFLVTDSQQKYTAADRYTNTFKPILYPLYDLFFDELRYNDNVADADMKHTKIDRVFWGRESGEGSLSNIFHDFIDAIEISNLKVKILKTC